VLDADARDEASKAGCERLVKATFNSTTPDLDMRLQTPKNAEDGVANIGRDIRNDDGHRRDHVDRDDGRHLLLEGVLVSREHAARTR